MKKYLITFKVTVDDSFTSIERFVEARLYSTPSYNVEIYKKDKVKE